MRDGLYNAAVWMPAELTVPFEGAIVPTYSAHALEESRNDRYGRVALPCTLDVYTDDVVEVEVRDGKPVKAVIRQPLDDRRDVVCVVNFPEVTKTSRVSFVRTVWINKANDAHKTLKRSLYINR